MQYAAVLQTHSIVHSMETNWDFQLIYAEILKECQGQTIYPLPQLDSPNFTIDDIGDGNLNHVEKITDGQNTIILKHAPPYIKCIGPEFPLSESRLDIEFSSLSLCHAKSPGSAPIPVHYSPRQHAVLMEYLCGYDVMKSSLIAGKVDKEAAHVLAQHVARIQCATHKNTLPQQEFQQLINSFKNPSMCALTEQFIFTRPFVRDDPTNSVLPRVLEEAERRVYDNQPLLTSIGSFKAKFLGSEECFVHGDLHTGSVMVKDGIAKIMDNEFSYVGPMAFDFGLLVAHYVVTYHQHRLLADTDHTGAGHSVQVINDVKEVIHDTVATYLAEVKDKLPGYSEAFGEDFLSQMAGFAGCELMRRVLGVAHVPDINGNEAAELEILKRGITLVGQHGTIRDAQAFVTTALLSRA